jgi:DNA-binding GntR family transcriptional regulator
MREKSLPSTDLKPIALLPALRQRRRTSEYVADALREAIRNGELADGTELNQVALAEHFGVSRVPIREAMFRLQAEGWITAKPHHSAVVQSLSRERIVEIFDLRILLETYLVERAIAAISPRAIDALERRCDAMDRITDRQDWLAANNAFHRALYEPSDAITTVALLDQLTSQSLRYVRAHGGSFARAPQAVAEHREILQAVRTGNVAEAQRLLRDHIGATRHYFVRTVEQ